MNGLEAASSVQRFLTIRHVTVLATVQADGGSMPTWFLHDPTTLTMIGVENTQKVRNVRRDPRVSVVMETAGVGGGDVRGVIVQGRAVFLPGASERRALAKRFHAAYPGLERLWAGRAMPPAASCFGILPSRVRAEWPKLRTTNVIERLRKELRCRVKPYASLPSEDAAVVWLFSLVASGQIKLRRIDGWRKIAAVLSQHTAVAA